MLMDHLFSFLTGISLMTRAGFPARTTLSPKDLLTTAPAPAIIFIFTGHKETSTSF